MFHSSGDAARALEHQQSSGLLRSYSHEIWGELFVKKAFLKVTAECKTCTLLGKRMAVKMCKEALCLFSLRLRYSVLCLQITPFPPIITLTNLKRVWKAEDKPNAPPPQGAQPKELEELEKIIFLLVLGNVGFGFIGWFCWPRYFLSSSNFSDQKNTSSVDENRTGDVLKTCKSLFQQQAVGKKLRTDSCGRPVVPSLWGYQCVIQIGRDF